MTYIKTKNLEIIVSKSMLKRQFLLSYIILLFVNALVAVAFLMLYIFLPGPDRIWGIKLFLCFLVGMLCFLVIIIVGSVRLKKGQIRIYTGKVIKVKSVFDGILFRSLNHPVILTEQGKRVVLRIDMDDEVKVGQLRSGLKLFGFSVIVKLTKEQRQQAGKIKFLNELVYEDAEKGETIVE